MLFIKKWLLPPGITWSLARARNRRRKAPDSPLQSSPFAAYLGSDWDLLRDALSDANVFLEYGSGTSTEFVVGHFGCQVRSIETDPEYADKVRQKVGTEAEIVHIDIGPIGSWGYPLTYSHANMFDSYFDAGFAGGFSPDVVLIDGRFRIACFLTSLLRTAPGTRIVFDDYTVRGRYHIVENFVKPNKQNSRQALFITPESIDEAEIRESIQRFAMVPD